MAAREVLPYSPDGSVPSPASCLASAHCGQGHSHHAAGSTRHLGQLARTPKVREMLRYIGLSLSKSGDEVAYVLLAPAQHPQNLQPHGVRQALEYLHCVRLINHLPHVAVRMLGLSR